MELKDKLKKLEEILEAYGQMIVSLSGGVDSTFLLAFAYKLWGDDRLAAFTATGPHFAADETEYAEKLCDRLGISLKKFDMSYIIEMVKRNPEDRCYHCKREMFGRLRERADIVGSVLADGTNLDDMEDYRPGYRAILEIGVASPLKDAGLTKADIRQALEELAETDGSLKTALGLTEKIWQKPAFACLASRIPYGETITEQKLEAIYKAEQYLRGKGFSQLRVRCHEIAGAVSGNASRFMARIELESSEISLFCNPECMRETEDKFRNLGFEYTALDLGGYSKGKLNDLIGEGLNNPAGGTPADGNVGSAAGEESAAAAGEESAAGTVADNRADRLKQREEVVRGNADNIRSADLMAEIDRFLQQTREKSYSFEDFVEIIARLRAPDGCPWDRAQTHESLKKHMVEETNEALEAIDEADWSHLCEELGDVLLQIVLHAQIAGEHDEFTMKDVVQTVSEKMIRRHPHVFGNIDVSSVDEGLDLWEEIKKREKAAR